MTVKTRSGIESDLETPSYERSHIASPRTLHTQSLLYVHTLPTSTDDTCNTQFFVSIFELSKKKSVVVSRGRSFLGIVYGHGTSDDDTVDKNNNKER